MLVSKKDPDYVTFVQRKVSRGEVRSGKRTHVDELDLPDLLHQLHGGVAVDEEGLGVVSQLQRLQPLRHGRGIVAVVADRPHLQGGRRRSAVSLLRCLNFRPLFCVKVELRRPQLE